MTLLGNYRSRIEIRFRPYESASMDQAPGPTNARPTAMAAASPDPQESRALEKVIQISQITTSTAATGVQRPASKRTPAPAATIGGSVRPASVAPASDDKQSWTRKEKTAARRTISPLPGKPFANVENSRCRGAYLEPMGYTSQEEVPNRVRNLPLSSHLRIDNSSFEADHGRVSTIARIQFHKNMLYTAFHCFLGR
jgi:hypothetical protein